MRYPFSLVILSAMGCVAPDAGLTTTPPSTGVGTPSTVVDTPSTVVPVDLALPVIRGVDGDCEPPDLASEVISLGVWIAASDDLVEGTVVDVVAAWDPLASRDGFLGGPSACDQAYIGFDVMLSDVVSRRSGQPLGALTVRLGNSTLGFWGVAATAAPGTSAVTWESGGAPLVAGMRIGGAIYHHAHVDHPVFMTGFREPLYEVDGGEVHFQQQAAALECAWPTPDVHSLSGLTPAQLEDAIAAAAGQSGGDLAAQYRAWLRVDDTSFDGSVSFTYTSYCSQPTSDETPP